MNYRTCQRGFCFVCVPIVLWCCAVPRMAAQTVARPEDDPKIRLETNVVSEKYCGRTYPDSGILQMRVGLRFTNAGSVPLILFRGGAGLQEVLISSSEEAAEAHRYELNWSISTQVAPLRETDAGATPGRNFVVLKHDETYTARALVPVPYRLVDGPGPPGILPSDHVLQIRVSTWPAPKELGQKLKDRWRAFGFLWFAPVTSEPMHFTTKARPPVVSCGNQGRTRKPGTRRFPEINPGRIH